MRCRRSSERTDSGLSAPSRGCNAMATASAAPGCSAAAPPLALSNAPLTLLLRWPAPLALLSPRSYSARKGKALESSAGAAARDISISWLDSKCATANAGCRAGRGRSCVRSTCASRQFLEHVLDAQKKNSYSRAATRGLSPSPMCTGAGRRRCTRFLRQTFTRAGCSLYCCWGPMAMLWSRSRSSLSVSCLDSARAVHSTPAQCTAHSSLWSLHSAQWTTRPHWAWYMATCAGSQ